MNKHNAIAHVERVKFDVTNPEHIRAFKMLTHSADNKVKQHPTLRFILEAPYYNVHSMMTAKIVAEYLKGLDAKAQVA